MTDVEQIAAMLTKAQREALIDLCDTPGLHTALYGSAIETMPRGLVTLSFSGPGGLLGLSRAVPSDLGLAVRAYLEQHNG